MDFDRFIGIDYSGAATPESRLPGLRISAAPRSRAPAPVAPPAGRHWTRRAAAEYCAAALTGRGRIVIGIDHAFGFPESYLARYGLPDWDAFLDDFVVHWPTDRPGCRVEAFRAGNPRSGDTREMRLCDTWTAGAKSVFQFDVQGSVAKSTHAGLPWIRRLRRNGAARVHFWPFDGFEVDPECSVVAEVFPSIFRRRYPRQGRTVDEHDAFCSAAWLRDMDRRGALARYFAPPVTRAERQRARREGWILGVA